MARAVSALLEYRCPRCRKRNDEASAVGPDGETMRPQPGDIGLCIACAAPLEFRAAMPPRWLTYDELVERTRDNAESRKTVMQAILVIVTMRPSPLQDVRWPGRK